MVTVVMYCSDCEFQLSDCELKLSDGFAAVDRLYRARLFACCAISHMDRILQPLSSYCGR